MKISNIDKWEKMFHELKAFYLKYGTTTISSKYPEYQKLRSWSNKQRSRRNNPKFVEKNRQLENIGFDFEPDNTKWNKWFEQLQNYKVRKGHTNIKYKDNDYYNLSIWLYNQKRAYRNGKLLEDRIVRLKKVGVDWLKK